MNLTIKILNAYNNYQNKILKKINKLNKDFKILNNIQNKIFTYSQFGGDYENINTFPTLQLNLELLSYLLTNDDINNTTSLLKKTQENTMKIKDSTDIISKKMNIINDTANQIVISAIEHKKKEIDIYNLIKENQDNIEKTTNELQQKQYIHPLLDKLDIDSFSDILKKLLEIQKISTIDTIIEKIIEINNKYKDLAFNILSKHNNATYHPYYLISPSIINDINQILINYLDIYFPLNETKHRNFVNNITTENTKLSFIWDGKDKLFNYDNYHNIKGHGSGTHDITITQELIDVLTLDSTAKERFENEIPPPPPGIMPDPIRN